MTTESGQRIDTRDPAINMARQILYRFAAQALMDPRTGNWKKLKEFEDDLLIHEAAAFLRSLHLVDRPQNLGPGEQPSSELCVKSLLMNLYRAPQRRSTRLMSRHSVCLFHRRARPMKPNTSTASLSSSVQMPWPISTVSMLPLG